MYRNIFHHLEEVIPCKHPPLLEPGKQAVPHDNVHAQGSRLVQENLTKLVSVCFQSLLQI